MIFLISGLTVLYLALLLTIYFVPLRRAVDMYPDVPSSAANVPEPDEAVPKEREPEPANA